MEGDKEIFKAILEPLIVDPVVMASRRNDFRLLVPLMMLSLRTFQTQSFSH
jgi:hypothetical protein